MNKNALKRLLWWCTLILRTASFIVPGQQRGEWLREWRGEVWHWANFLAESERLNARTEHELLRHCWGSFRDALWCRFNRATLLGFIDSYPTKPSFCLLAIAVPMLVLIAVKPIRMSSWTLAPSTATDPSSLLCASQSNWSQWIDPDDLRGAVSILAAHSRLIQEAETYAWRTSVVIGPEGKQTVLAARVSPGIFDLLRVRPILGSIFTPDRSASEQSLVISYRIWKTQFKADPNVIGKTMYLNGRTVEIIGVLPAEFRFPGLNIALYTPFGAGLHPRLPNTEWSGALLRVQKTSELPKKQLRSQIDETLPPANTVQVLSPRDLEYQAIESCLVLVAVVILCLLALHWRSLARLIASASHLRLKSAVRWWLFFVFKSSLLILAALIVSTDFVGLTVSSLRINIEQYGGGEFIWVFVVLSTLMLSWAIRDQASRCRACLRRMRMQISMGTSVGPFNEPSGSDLLCEAGHGVLHVPALRSTCLDSEKWTNLDESWQELLHSA